jgi:multidrug resistance efflux pump
MPHTSASQTSQILFNALEGLTAFSGNPSQFLTRLIEIKQTAVHAKSAALIRLDSSGTPGLITASPAMEMTGQPPGWLKIVLSNPDKLLNSPGINCHFIARDNGFESYLVSMPLDVKEYKNGTEIYVLQVKDKTDLQHRIEMLQVLMPYYSYFESKSREQEYKAKTNRLYTAFAVLMKLGECEEFLEAGLCLCNEISARWSCSRVSFGVFNGRNVKFKALSNSEKFNPKMDMVRELVSVMEESVDQNLEIVYPQQGDGVYVCRQAQNFSKKHGPLSILSVPMRRNGNIFGVITLEREETRPFSDNEIQLYRLIAELFAPQLYNLKLKDRPFFLKWGDGIKNLSSLALGAKHTWIKLIIIFLIVSGIWLSQQKVMYKVESTFSFESENARIISAPFSGKISRMFVENGDIVTKESPLFQLDITELELKLKKLQAQKIQLLKKVAVALRENKPAQEQIARAEIKATEAQTNLIQYSIDNALIKATMSGTIVGNDLKKLQFSVVPFGKTILELVETQNVAPALFIPEDQIADIALSQTGELAATGYPDRKIKFEIISIEKNAVVLAQKNVFKAKARILDTKNTHQNIDQNINWVRQGMEGVALVDIEPRLMIWVYTRKAVNWARMYFWL